MSDAYLIQTACVTSSCSSLAVNGVDPLSDLNRDPLAGPILVDHRPDVLPSYTQSLANLSHNSLILLDLAKFLPQSVVVPSDVVTLHNANVITLALRTVNTKMHTGAQLAKTPWAKKIGDLAEKLGSGAKLARALGVSPMSVSRWINGDNEPSADLYLKMGKLAGDPDCWYFWDRAGLKYSDILDVAPALEERLASRREPVQLEVILARGAVRGDGQLKRKPDVVAVPLLRDSAAAGEPRMIEAGAVEDMLLLRRKECPHPEETVCIRVEGSSMEPLLLDGFIVAVDTHPVDIATLDEKMVAARGPDGGVTIKWFRQTKAGGMLVPQHTSPDYDPILLSAEHGWAVIGVVLFWIGRPPKAHRR